MTERISRRALNRATLARQLLLERAKMPVVEAIERLAGLQAQIPHTWYAGLGVRLDGITPEDVADLLVGRQIVRIALMRSTIHLVSARDVLWLRPLMQPVLDRDLFRNHTHGKPVEGLDMDELVAAARPLLEEMILRYLAAFGPASVMDVQTWSGLTRLKAVMERLRPRLVTFEDGNGRELFDLPEAPRPAPETPAPPRLLYGFDNLLLSHADRSRFITEDYRAQNYLERRPSPSIVLVDGFTAGEWTLATKRDEAVLTIRTYEELPAATPRRWRRRGTG